MNTTADRLQIDAVDFRIACRRFTIRATVTKDRQLPVVDEFVLRLLAVLDRMPVSRMRAWFGFSEREIETVLLDMGRRKLIEFDGNDITLAPSGRDLFQSVGEGGVPQVVEVAPLIANVWFDLGSRNMVPRSRNANTDYLLQLPEQPNARELPEEFARQAFEENFRDYVKRIRRLPDADATNLYSISDVEGGSFGYQLLPSKLMLNPDKLEVRNILEDVGDNAPAFQKLTIAANDAWRYAGAPDPSPTTATEFEKLTGHRGIQRLINDPSAAESWIEVLLRTGKQEGDFLPTVGASYLRPNLDKLTDIISALERDEHPVKLIWLRPGGSAWGRTLRVPDALQQVRTACRNRGRLDKTATLVMPRSTQRPVRTSHRRLFDNGFLLPQGHLPPNLEILLIPNVAAYVNVHLQVGGQSVPVGGIVTNQKRIQRIVERLNMRREGWESLWQSSKSRGEHED